MTDLEKLAVLAGFDGGVKIVGCMADNFEVDVEGVVNAPNYPTMTEAINAAYEVATSIGEDIHGNTLHEGDVVICYNALGEPRPKCAQCLTQSSCGGVLIADRGRGDFFQFKDRDGNINHLSAVSLIRRAGE